MTNRMPLSIVAIGDGCVLLPDAEVGLVVGGEIPWTFVADERRVAVAQQVHGALKAWNDGPIECLITDAPLQFDEVDRIIRTAVRRHALHDRLLSDFAAMMYQAAHTELAPKRTVWRLPGPGSGGGREVDASIEARMRRAQDRARRWATLLAGATQTPTHVMDAESIAQLLYALADPYRRRWTPIERILARTAAAPGGVRVPLNGFASARRAPLSEGDGRG